MTFIDLRDRYGITQLVLEADADAALVEKATSLGREYVIQAIGEVVERQSKNPKMGTVRGASVHDRGRERRRRGSPCQVPLP